MLSECTLQSFYSFTLLGKKYALHFELQLNDEVHFQPSFACDFCIVGVIIIVVMIVIKHADAYASGMKLPSRLWLIIYLYFAAQSLPATQLVMHEMDASLFTCDVATRIHHLLKGA